MFRKKHKFAGPLLMNNSSVSSDIPHSLPTSLQDTGTIRIGNMSPAFKTPVIPQGLKDKGKHRIGNMSPIFRL